MSKKKSPVVEHWRKSAVRSCSMSQTSASPSFGERWALEQWRLWQWSSLTRRRSTATRARRHSTTSHLPPRLSRLDYSRSSSSMNPTSSKCGNLLTLSILYHFYPNFTTHKKRNNLPCLFLHSLIIVEPICYAIEKKHFKPPWTTRKRGEGISSARFCFLVQQEIYFSTKIFSFRYITLGHSWWHHLHSLSLGLFLFSSTWYIPYITYIYIYSILFCCYLFSN